MQTRVSRILLSSISRRLSRSREASILENPPSRPLPLIPFIRTAHLSTIPNRPMSNNGGEDEDSEEFFLRSLRFGEEKKTHQDQQAAVPDRPLRVERRPAEPFQGDKRSVSGTDDLFPDAHHQIPNRPMRGEGREGIGGLGEKFERGRKGYGKIFDLSINRGNHKLDPISNVREGNQSGDTLFQKLNLEDVHNDKEVQGGEGREGIGRSGEKLEHDRKGYGKDFEVSSQFAVRSRGEERSDLSIKRGDQQIDPISSEEEGNQSGDTLFQKLDIGDVHNNKVLEGEGREGIWCLGEKFERDRKGYGKDFEVLSRLAVRSRGEKRNDVLIDPINSEREGNQSGDTLFQKLNVGDVHNNKEVEGAHRHQSTRILGSESAAPEPPQDAGEIFKKMKDSGLIPDAVAMLDGLCKDGLIQEAMKLFGLMREKGTMPEIVIYTAVVEGFCKAAKFDDAKRIFRKMQKNGIAPNAYSFTVMIQGLFKGGKLEDSIEFFMEMVNAGHVPNVATFTGLVHGLCKEKGLEEADSVVKNLKERGFLLDEKAVREHLDKKGPFSPMVWEAIFGKRTSQRSF